MTTTSAWKNLQAIEPILLIDRANTLDAAGLGRENGKGVTV
jgi:hypothetical protein